MVVCILIIGPRSGSPDARRDGTMENAIAITNGQVVDSPLGKSLLAHLQKYYPLQKEPQTHPHVENEETSSENDR